jgi:hypothetical protein
METFNQDQTGTLNSETSDTLKRLETYGALVTECNRYALLGRNAERNRHTVRPHIYARVKKEYEEKKETLDQEQEEQKQCLRAELETILENRRALNERCRQESDRLEELDFRVRVGEFSEEEAQDTRKKLKEELLEITMALADAQEVVSKFEQVGLLPQAPRPAAETDRREREEPGQDQGDFLVLEERPSSEDEDVPVVLCPAEPHPGSSLQDNVFGYLVALDGSRRGERFPLVCSEMTVGSSPDIDIRLADAGIARFHARIVYKNQRHYIETIEKPGSFLVNGVQKDKSELRDGDVLSLGKIKMQVEYPREANA